MLFVCIADMNIIFHCLERSLRRSLKSGNVGWRVKLAILIMTVHNRKTVKQGKVWVYRQTPRSI